MCVFNFDEFTQDLQVSRDFDSFSLIDQHNENNLCGIKALFGIFWRQTSQSQETFTLFTLCFHSQPRGGPELLGAPLLGAAGSERFQARVGGGHVRAWGQFKSNVGQGKAVRITPEHGQSRMEMFLGPGQVPLQSTVRSTSGSEQFAILWNSVAIQSVGRHRARAPKNTPENGRSEIGVFLGWGSEPVQSTVWSTSGSEQFAFLWSYVAIQGVGQHSQSTQEHP